MLVKNGKLYLCLIVCVGFIMVSFSFAFGQDDNYQAWFDNMTANDLFNGRFLSDNMVT